MKRLILHIGDHKTGTSALQQMLATGVADDHALYPSAGRAQGLGHQNLAWQCGSDRRFKPKLGGWADVAAEVALSNKPNIILSAEAFEFQNPATSLSMACAAFEGIVDRIDIVIYLRAHGDRVTSSFAERVRRGIGPFCLDAWIEQSLAERRFHYAPRLERWHKAATDHAARSSVAISLRPAIYDKARLKHADIVPDFLQQTLNVDYERATPTRANTAPGGAALDLMCSVFARLANRGSPADLRRLSPRIAAAAASVLPSENKLSFRPLQGNHLLNALLADAEATDAFCGPQSAGYFCSALRTCENTSTASIQQSDLDQVIDCLSHAILGEVSAPPGKASFTKPSKAAA